MGNVPSNSDRWKKVHAHSKLQDWSLKRHLHPACPRRRPTACRSGSGAVASKAPVGGVAEPGPATRAGALHPVAIPDPAGFRDPRGHFASGPERPPPDRHHERHRPRHPCGVVRRQWCQRLRRDHPSRSEGRRFPDGMFAPALHLRCGGGREGCRWPSPRPVMVPAGDVRRRLSSRSAEPMGKPYTKAGVHGRPPVRVICLPAQVPFRDMLPFGEKEQA